MQMRELFKRRSKKKIMVVGDIMLDSYISGEVYRISPEAPVPVLTFREKRNVLGGAANVARNLAVWNAETFLFGALGNDEAGTEIEKILAGYGVKISSECTAAGRSTISKIRLVATSQHICRMDFENSPPAYAPSESLMKSAMEKIPECDAVIVSDYAKGFITEKFLQEMIDLSNACGKILCLDPKPSHKLNFRRPYLLKPNRREALELAGLDPDSGEPFPAETVCRIISEKFEPKHLLITIGGKGMILASAGKIRKVLPARKVSVFDVSGAGDTVVSMLAFGLSCGMRLEEAVAAASKAAAIVVGKFGTAQAEIKELCAVS